MRATNTVMVATTNTDKLAEYAQLFLSYPNLEFAGLEEIVSNPSQLSLVEENGKTYYDNAHAKGRIAHLASKLPTLSDDTGIEVDALDGRPGVRSHRYAMPRAGETQDIANNKKLLTELNGIPKDKRTARFTCTLCFFVEGVVLTSTASIEGTILEAPRGTHGFGYDALFLVKGIDKTLAELTLEEKNKISHRAKAFHQIMQEIRSKNVAFVRP
jgi:XTP/dITP diphosphohydrolase